MSGAPGEIDRRLRDLVVASLLHLSADSVGLAANSRPRYRRSVPIDQIFSKIIRFEVRLPDVNLLYSKKCRESARCMKRLTMHSAA